MSWFPIGPNAVFYPHDPNFTRLSRRNEAGGQGQVSNITIDATYADAPNRIYVTGAPNGGGGTAFRTDDGGNSWVRISDSLDQPDSSNHPTCFAINPLQPLVYMGTQSGAIYSSGDLGQSWVLLAQLPAGNNSANAIFKLVVDPRTAADPGTTVIYAAKGNGLFRSPDGGATFVDVFQTVLGQPGSSTVTSFSAYMPPGGDDRYYIGCPEYNIDGQPPMAGLLFSSDLLSSLVNLNNQGIGLPTLAFGQVGSILVDYCPLKPDRVYVCFQGGPPANGICTTSLPPTSQSATAWTAVPQMTPFPVPGNMSPLDPFAVAPNSVGDGMTDILFYGNITLNRSPDSGRSWQTEGEYAVHPDHHAYVFYSAAGNPFPTLYVGCDGGLAMSTQHCNPNFNAATAATYFNELDSVDPDATPALGAYQNLNRGRQSSGIYCYATSPAIAALSYIGCQDTGANAGSGSLGWLGISNGDLLSAAVAAGPQGVTLWGAFESDSNHIRCFRNQNTAASFAQLNGAPAAVNGNSQLCATLDGACLAALFVAGAPPTPTSYFVATIDQNGNASPISSDMGSPGVVFAIHPSNPDILYCGTSDSRILSTVSGSTANSLTVWTEALTAKPALLSGAISSIAIDPPGDVYALLTNPVSSGANPPTPLYQITAAGSWVPLPFSGAPLAGNYLYGGLLADPVQPGTFYAFNANKVYQISLAGGNANWQDISGDLPPVPVSDLWVGNIGTAAAPKVLLRAAVYPCGMFECDVTAGAVAPAVTLYLRDNLLDMGWLPRCPENVPNPYTPLDPGATLFHHQCADIKLDYLQTSASGASYFQTDPETPPPITGVIFDELNDRSQNLPSADQAWVHVQVQNRANTAPVDPVWVWVLHCKAAAGVPALYTSFWDQFKATGSIMPNVPATSLWTPVGDPINVNQANGLTAAAPQVASWQFTLPTLASGDPGHYCFVAFVHSTGSASLANLTSPNVDGLTPINRQIGQKNTHIVPPLPPHMRHLELGWLEEIAFHNPSPEPREATLVVEARGLPPELALALQFSPLDTMLPLPDSIRGLISRPLSVAEDFEPEADSQLECRCYENLRRSLAGLHRLRCNSPVHAALPAVAPEIYDAEPSPRVEVRGVRIPAYGKVKALIHLRNTGELEPGSEFRFQVLQEVGGVVAGGGMYIVPIAGKKPVVRQSFPTAAPLRDGLR